MRKLGNTKQFNQDEKEIIYKLYQSGESCLKIGLKFGCREKPIARILTREFGVVLCNYNKPGDIINGWEILDVYWFQGLKQKFRIAKIKSTIHKPELIKEVKLTILKSGALHPPCLTRCYDGAHTKTHNESKTKLYGLWCGIINRTTDGTLARKETNYEKYNIKICDEWKKYENFAKWARENGYVDGLSIDRIDPLGNYKPNNCRIINRRLQNRNKITSRHINLTAFGETKSAYEWAEDNRCKITLQGLFYRVDNGWSHELAILTPSERNNKRKSSKILYSTNRRLNRLYQCIKYRCKNPPIGSSYKKYNIQICKEWLDFYKFKEWSLKNGYSNELSIDRIDNTKGYCPENCRWITKSKQVSNRMCSRGYELEAFGETKHTSDWAMDKRCCVKLSTLMSRLKSGWDAESAISTPSRKKCR